MTEMPFTQETVIVASPDAISANLGNEEVLLNLKSGIYFGLNEVGARIWSLLEKPCTVAHILKTLLSEYEVDLERCMTDLLALLGDLSQAQLIQVRND